MKKVRPMMPHNIGRVLDIGSLDINGSAREYFTEGSTEYIGIDMVEGKGVDIVMNAHDLSQKFAAYSFDTIICMNTLEHDNKFWLTIAEINKLVKNGGYFVFAQPTIDFPIHNHPLDYWRLTRVALEEVIFDGFDIIDIEQVYSKKVDDPTHRKGWRGINPILCGLGKAV